MKDIFRTKSIKLMDEEIARLTVSLGHEDPTTKDYALIVDNLKVLCEAREKESPLTIKPETLLMVGANILGLLVVLNFERTGVITSKAINMLWKGRS